MQDQAAVLSTYRYTRRLRRESRIVKSAQSAVNSSREQMVLFPCCTKTVVQGLARVRIQDDGGELGLTQPEGPLR
jgi:hypothetical protein